jgi:hypothetical protein
MHYSRIWGNADGDKPIALGLGVGVKSISSNPSTDKITTKILPCCQSLGNVTHYVQKIILGDDNKQLCYWLLYLLYFTIVFIIILE